MFTVSGFVMALVIGFVVYIEGAREIEGARKAGRLFRVLIGCAAALVAWLIFWVSDGVELSDNVRAIVGLAAVFFVGRAVFGLVRRQENE